MGMSSGGGDGHFNSSGSMMAEINVTPMVDVMLVLLIIFMVTAPLLQQGVEVALPKAAATGLDTATETTLVVSVSRDGKVFMAADEVSMQKLGESLQVVVANNPDKQVLLKADKEVPYGVVAQVMATIRRSGVTRLGMVTQAEDGAAQ